MGYTFLFVWILVCKYNSVTQNISFFFSVNFNRVLLFKVLFCRTTRKKEVLCLLCVLTS